ncbi:MAG: AraC family transcriptional regulator [Blastococcus sp.]
MRPRVRTNTLTGYAGLARSSGLDPAVLMAGVGLDVADLDVPDRWIPAAPVARLLELSAQGADCPDFALRLAGLRRLGTLGPISVVLREEPDLRSALDLLIRYENAYTEPLRLRLRETDDLATLEMWLEFGEPTPHGQALDLVMGALMGIIRALVRSDWEPLSASFARPAPPDARPWLRVFGPGVVFDRDFTGVVFRVQDLDAPVLTSDSSIRPYTQEFLHTVVAREAPAGDKGVADVLDAVELLLPLGRHSMLQVSRHLGLSSRALQRYLADHGETFSSIVHTTRARLAERYLPNERYSLTEVSLMLGFGAPSAFSRWFRQQFGTSATEWRKAARAESRTAIASDNAGEG